MLTKSTSSAYSISFGLIIWSNSGLISLSVFSSVCTQVFDSNGDGVIDAGELRQAMKNLGEPLSDKELTDMMKEADLDKDGKICYEGWKYDIYFFFI